jgi:carboxyl-terminal processing protease
VTGSEGSTAQFTFQRGDGSLLEARLTRRKLSTRAFAVQRVLPSGFGYLRFSQWTVGVMPRVTEALQALRATPGLIIDLRGNPGGSLHMVNLVLGHFFRERAELGRILTRTGRPISLLFGTVEVIKLHTVVEGDPQAYRGPVVILVNAQSGSASELFAATLQASGRATIVGEPSCGCLLGFLGYSALPGGGELAYSEIGFVMSNGRRIEGEGVMPDRPVPATLADLVVSRDRALEVAQQVLAAQGREAEASRKNADAGSNARAPDTPTASGAR